MTARTRRLLIAASVSVLTVFWIGFGLHMARHQVSSDAVMFYAAGDLTLRGEIERVYDGDGFREHMRLLGSPPDKTLLFLRPPFYAAVLAPFALLPASMARGVWLGMQWVILAACWWWAARRFRGTALLWGALGYPAAAGIAHGQDCGLVLGLSVAGFALHERGRPGWAGLTWSLCLIKFNLVALLPLGLALAHWWRVLWGFGAGALVLGAVSAWLIPVQQYARFVLSNPYTSANSKKFINLNSAIANLELPEPLVYLGYCAVLALFAAGARRGPIWRVWLVSILASVLVSPHAFLYDGAILLLGLWMTLAWAPSVAPRLIAGVYGLPFVPWLTQVGGKAAAVPPLLLAGWLTAIVLTWTDAEAGKQGEHETAAERVK